MSEEQDRLVTLLRQRHADVIDGPGWTVPWDLDDFVHNFGNVASALVHSILFVPEFVEVAGHVFLRDLGPGPRDIPALTSQMAAVAAKSSAHLKRIVASYNWVEVPYLFVDRSGSDDEVRLLADRMADSWRVRLQARFPDRQFVIRVMEPAETGSVLGVGFEEL